MKVKVGDTIYDSENEPIMVILTDDAKQNIRNMLPECYKYCEYPDNRNAENILTWMRDI